MFKSKLIIKKTEAGTEIGLEGGVFELFDSSGAIVATGTTGVDGMLTFAIKPCSRLFLREIIAPAGYLVNDTIYKISADSCGNVKIDNSALQPLIVENQIGPTPAPTINTIFLDDTQVTGGGISGCNVTVIFPDSTTATVIVNQDGSWSVPIATELVQDDIVKAFQQCGEREESEIVETIVRPQAFSVEYNANGGGGEFQEYSYSTHYIVKSPEEAEITAPVNYKFFSWNTEPDGSGTMYLPGYAVVLPGSVVLYAQWYTTYNIYYRGNGGLPSTATIIGISSIVPYTIPTAAGRNIYREGYSFVNWNTESDGSGVTYEAGQVIYLTESLFLYAQWVQN